MIAIIPAESSQQTKNVSLRWTYLALPGALLLLSVILAACFYQRLPSEVGYHFENGSPDGWMGRGAFIAWMIVPQFVLALFALAVVSVATILSKHFLPENTPLRKVLAIMGNMVALPQIILTFAMLDIFLYNIYKIHIMPLWGFVLIVMVSGGIILGVFLIQALRQFRGLNNKFSGSDGHGETGYR